MRQASTRSPDEPISGSSSASLVELAERSVLLHFEESEDVHVTAFVLPSHLDMSHPRHSASLYI